MRGLKIDLNKKKEKDPFLINLNRFNTSLTKEEEKEFQDWVRSESKEKGRDILMDMGSYDLKGFWKSGDYKKTDSDGHGTDKWKKPNHPTFSNQSVYSGKQGNKGGIWSDDGGYTPSKETLKIYNPEFYDNFFTEPNRPEYLKLDSTNMELKVSKKKKTSNEYNLGGPISPLSLGLMGGNILLNQINQSGYNDDMAQRLSELRANNIQLARIGSDKTENFSIPQLNKGGKIKGKGTSKSDSISAKLDNGGFIVPAENAKIAENIREMFFPDTMDKMASMQGGNTPVKISDGEHYFDPQEVEILTENGIDLGKLAPNSSSSNKMAKGGKVTLKNGESYEVDSLRTYTSEDGNLYISVIGEDGKEKEKITDPDKIRAIQASVEFNEAGQGVERRTSADPSDVAKRTGVAIAGFGKSLLGETAEFKEGINKTLKFRGATDGNNITTPVASPLNNTKTRQAAIKELSIPPPGSIDFSQPSIGDQKREKAFSATKTDEITNTRDTQPLSIPLTAMEKREIKQQPRELPRTLLNLNNEEMQSATNSLLDNGEQDVVSKENPFRLSAENVLAGGQLIGGALGLMKQGDEPRLETSKLLSDRLDQAREDEKRGFDPIERAAIDRQIESNKNTGLRLSSELSGGNRFAAFSNSSAVLAKANEQRKEVAAKDAELRRAKLGRTDSMINAVYADRTRKTLSDQEIFRQNQGAFAGLLNTGVQNILGGIRFNRYLKEREKTNQPTNINLSI